MQVAEAKNLVLRLLVSSEHQPPANLVKIDPNTPDKDQGKFLINGRAARIIHHFNGWFAPINLDWFSGSYDQPSIHKTPFYWYAFAVPKGRRYTTDHYFICDYLQMREWVLSFKAPLGKTHQDRNAWRCDLRLYPGERNGYFRWGDEPPGVDDQPERVFEVDNLGTLAVPVPPGQHVGTFGNGGESAAHKLLKLYIANHPSELGLSVKAVPHVEYSFATGDRVDLLFDEATSDRIPVEIEVEGETQVCIGIMQAIKYRALAAADAGYPLTTPRVRSFVIAYQTDYPKARQLARKYDIGLISVDREKVLGRAN